MITAHICLYPGSLSQQELLEIYEAEFKAIFEKKTSRASAGKRKINQFFSGHQSAEFLWLDTKDSADGWLSFRKDKYDFFDFSSAENIHDRLIESFINKGVLFYAYCYDTTFVNWQNQQMLTNYKSFGRDYSHLKIIPGSQELFDKVDISNNPGRYCISSDGIQIMAAWKAWFSKQMAGLFKCKSLLEFPGAFTIRELTNDIIFIQLYESVENSESGEALGSLESFREWVKMDEICR